MMNNSNHISEIWTNLENEKNSGLVKRMYSSDCPFHIFGTFKYPEIYYGIAFSFSDDTRIDLSSFGNLSELDIVLLEDSSFPDSKLLVIQLLDSASRDIFSVLCENLVHSVFTFDSEQMVIRTVVNQLVKWEALFKRNNSSVLTPIEQQGLYGELYFLKRLLTKHKCNICNTLQLWVGADKSMRDFQGDGWAIEVKTSSANNCQKAIVNGERQLDETHLNNLYLFHLSVEVSRENGQSLCDMIDEIYESLIGNASAIAVFNAKLFEAGYSDCQKYIYESRCYKIRSEHFYDIRGDFPRIKENDLRNGVSDIKYTISLSMCDDYLVSEGTVLNTILSHE